MSYAYILKHTLSHTHSESVNCLEFSSSGEFLASGSDDHSLIIWNVSTGQDLYHILFDSPVTALLWHPSREQTIVCGCEDGTIVQMSRFTLKGFSRKQINIAAQGPVHFLAYNESRHYLAIAIGHEVLVRRETRDGIEGFVRLPEPQVEQSDYEPIEDRKLRPRGIHFHKAGTELIVTYLNHGVMCYDLDTLGMTWQILPKPDGLRIGSSAISADAEALLLHNIQEGLYMYRIGQTRPSRVFTIDDAAHNKYALPVLFLHHNTAIVSGAEDGKVRIRQTTGEEFQTLYHDNDIIQALACFQGRENYNYIATGTTRKGQKTYIRIWRAAITSSEPQSEFGSVVNTIVSHGFTMSSRDYWRLLKWLFSLAISLFLIIVVIQVTWAGIPWIKVGHYVLLLIETVYHFTVFMMLQMRQWMKWTATYLCNAYASAIGVLRQQLRDFLEVDHPEVIRIRHANYEL